ncbi:uncharacterized protein LOC144763405 [Lissotriton helveticus]
MTRLPCLFSNFYHALLESVSTAGFVSCSCHKGDTNRGKMLKNRLSLVQTNIPQVQYQIGGRTDREGDGVEKKTEKPGGQRYCDSPRHTSGKVWLEKFETTNLESEGFSR